jgi:diacylglycerol kinase family enzyme
MILFLNTRAAGGTALKKWRKIESEFIYRFRPRRIHMPQSVDAMRDRLQHAIENGEIDFVAAGGDGTVNALLNSICEIARPNELPGIRLGAVGLGSSNDFHKPFLEAQFVGDVPCKVDFRNAYLRDIGCLTLRENGHKVQRYFLANASSGVTAEANRFFNNPTVTLEFLKRISTGAAIAYAAVRTILLYRNFECTIQVGQNKPITTLLTNLAVMKSPHVSGSFLYDTPVAQDDGAFAINLSECMSKPELLYLLYSLSQGRFTNLRHTQSWLQPSITISCPEPVAVEYDGEIVTARSAEFTVLRQHIQVCP